MNYYKTFFSGFLENQKELLITSDFGKRDLEGEIRPHNGIDIGVPQGTVLLSPLEGTIIKKYNQKKGAGLYVKIRHDSFNGGKIDILLMHLHSVEPYINLGYKISEGEKIGTTGGAKGDPNAGHSTGPHIHIEIRKGGVALDPKYYFLGKETLIIKKTRKKIYDGDLNMISFPSNFIKTQTSYPFSHKNNTTIKNETEIKPNKKKVENVVEERLAPGIWQIIKILIDSSVINKQVLDSGISTQQGSLLNFFRKVCQSPLVEFSGDTFGNQYYWFVRKPPFDEEGMKKMIDLTMIELNQEDIISTNLSWNNENIYSWYQYMPTADLLGVRESNLFMPAVFFPEFASIWGSKPMCVESNYFNYVFSGKYNSDKNKNKENSDRIIRNAVKDFKYLIESNAYNAFTRKGTITLIGDRRIKRGTLILHTSGEVFYVDSVTNSYEVTMNGVNRVTSLSVSKGMYPEYIYGKLVGMFKNVSYFNIINFGENFDIEKVNSDNWKDIISKWKVNLDSFGFFMSKQQVFLENINTKQK